MPMAPAEMETFLQQPTIAVLATIGRKGRPHAVPVWFLWEDGAAYFTTGRGSKKWRNIEGDDRVSLCVYGTGPTRPAVILEGTATEVDRPYAPLSLRIAQHYLGAEEGQSWFDSLGENPGQSSVIVRITPERVLSWGSARDA